MMNGHLRTYLRSLRLFLGIVPTLSMMAVACSQAPATPAVPVGMNATRPACSQPPTFAGDSSSEFLDGDVRYSLMQAASYADIRSGGGVQTIWAIIGMRNEGARTVELNPWFDLWLMPLPLGVNMPYPPQPTYVDVLEIGGPLPLPNHSSLLLEAGESCMLQLTFQLPQQVLRAVLNIGYVQAFSIDLNSEGIGP